MICYNFKRIHVYTYNIKMLITINIYIVEIIIINYLYWSNVLGNQQMNGHFIKLNVTRIARRRVL